MFCMIHNLMNEVLHSIEFLEISMTTDLNRTTHCSLTRHLSHPRVTYDQKDSSY